MTAEQRVEVSMAQLAQLLGSDLLLLSRGGPDPARPEYTALTADDRFVAVRPSRDGWALDGDRRGSWPRPLPPWREVEPELAAAVGSEIGVAFEALSVLGWYVVSRDPAVAEAAKALRTTILDAMPANACRSA